MLKRLLEYLRRAHVIQACQHRTFVGGYCIDCGLEESEAKWSSNW